MNHSSKRPSAQMSRHFLIFFFIDFKLQVENVGRKMVKCVGIRADERKDIIIAIKTV